MKDLVDLTAVANDKDGKAGPPGLPGIYPSCGGSDEFMRFYVCRKTLPKVPPSRQRDAAPSRDGTAW